MIRLMKMLSVTAAVAILFGFLIQCNKSSSNDSANNLLLYYLSTQGAGVFVNSCSSQIPGTCQEAYKTAFTASTCNPGTVSTSQCNCSGAVGTCVGPTVRIIYYSSNYTIASAQAQCNGTGTWTVNCLP